MLALACGLLVAAMLLASTSGPAAAVDMRRFGGSVNVAAEGEDDLWAMGGDVTILGNVAEDVWAAGGRVEVDVTAGGDVWIAGANTELRGSVAEDAWIGGANILVDAKVGQNLHAAGANVEVTQASEIGRNSSLYGATVVFRGRAGPNLNIAADSIVFEGTVEGPLTLEGRRVEIGDGARIAGELTIYSVNQPMVSPRASLAGQPTVQPSRPATGAPQPTNWLFTASVLLAFAASAFVLGLALLLLMPDVTNSMVRSLRSRAPLTAVNGLLALVGGIAVALVLIVSLIGAPLGFFLLLALPLLALAGHAVTGLTIAELVFNRDDDPLGWLKRAALLAAGVVFVAAFGFIPYVGWLIILALLVFGMGSVMLTLGAFLFGRGAGSTPSPRAG
jgi:hypothetical protein